MGRLVRPFVFSLTALASIGAFLSPAAAMDDELVGTWRLVSLVREEFKAGTAKEVANSNVQGAIVFTPDGRYFVSVAECATAAAVASAHEMTIMHAGQYEVVGDKLVQRIEMAPTQALVGVTQHQFIGWLGNRLVLESTPIKRVVYGTTEIRTLVFERSQ